MIKGSEASRAALATALVRRRCHNRLCDNLPIAQFIDDKRRQTVKPAMLATLKAQKPADHDLTGEKENPYGA
jgi:hypothetical protein